MSVIASLSIKCLCDDFQQIMCIIFLSLRLPHVMFVLIKLKLFVCLLNPIIVKKRVVDFYNVIVVVLKKYFSYLSFYQRNTLCEICLKAIQWKSGGEWEVIDETKLVMSWSLLNGVIKLFSLLCMFEIFCNKKVDTLKRFKK